MKDIKVLVDNDMINNPFWEVQISIEEGDKITLETEYLINLASIALPQVDKIVTYRGKLRDEIIVKTARGGVMGWERMGLRGTVEHVIGSRVWKSCEDLGVGE